MKHLLCILTIAFCAACMPLLATGDERYPLAPADEVWLHGYIQGIHDACVHSMVAFQKEIAGDTSSNQRNAISRECRRIANDVEDRMRARIYYDDHYAPTPTPPRLPESTGA